MSWKNTVNKALVKTTGHELRRTGSKAARAEGRRAPRRGRRPGDRLVSRPAFVLCTVRSGSTLLRMLLNSHSQIHSPHEMHLRSINVQITGKYGDKALAEVKLDRDELNHVLWDWYLHRELATTGKKLLVNKTPNDVFIAMCSLPLPRSSRSRIRSHSRYWSCLSSRPISVNDFSA